jgi:retron-type reverse transcriptase
MDEKIEKSTLDITQIKIYGITFNLDVSIKRLKQDLRDDWFPDFLDYKDVFGDNSFFLDKLEKYIGKNTLYEASPAIHFDIPKPGFTIRYSSETNIIDRLMYQACVDVIAPTLDKIHSESNYSHRINTDWGNKYFFRHAVNEWNKFLTDALLELNKEENEVLLLTDLSNYYESISIRDLTNTLNFQIKNLGLSNEQETEFNKVATQLNSLLDTWCEPNTKRGIPQNRDASSFLSNLFLNPVDDAMLKSGYKFFRYMDDIRVVCKDKFEARKALKVLVNELRKKGLNVNSKKTQILDLNNEQQRSVVNEAMKKSDKKIDQIENFLKSKKARGVQVAVPILREKTISLIESGGTLDRHFRFCVNRLERLIRIPELKTKLDLEEITDAIISELLNQPWSTDTFSRYLISSELSPTQMEKIMSIIIDDKKNIYEWQEFHLWRVLIKHRYSNVELFSKARKNLIQKATSTPIIAGSILYLCAIGDGNDRKHVADSFSNLTDFFSQRIALIGIKSLDYTSVIKPSVEKHLDSSLKGCYSKLRDNFKEIFFYNPSQLNYRDFYDELPEFIS